MTASMRFPVGTALLISIGLGSCKHAPDPAQLTAVDQLIEATEAAALTLRELNRGRYAEADSLLAADSALFAQRFNDTLYPDDARALGNQWLALRHAAGMGDDHERTLADLIEAAERLRLLRADIAGSAFRDEQAAAVIRAEQERHTAVIGNVHAVIDNYRLLQHAWDRRDTVALLLAGSDAP